jgi:predicted dehydrogenase
LKFLIAGLGSIGRRHLRNLVTLGQNEIILLRSGKATLPEEELAGYPQESDLKAALQKHKPDAVIVSNPTAMHLDVAIPAVHAGCAILLEKPLSNSMFGLDKLEAEAEHSESKILIGFQFRFHPGLQSAKEWISSGEIGRVISAHVHFGEYLPAWHPWEDYRKSYAARAEMGGGVVLTQSHALDYLPWLIEKVESVWGFTAKLSDLQVDVEDTAKVGLRFSGGALGSLHLDYNQQPPVHRFEIVGTNGSIHWDLTDGISRMYRSEQKDWQISNLPPDWERNTMFLEEMSHFLKVVSGDMQPLCTLEEGVRVQRLIQAIHDSNKSGKTISLQ